MVAQQPVEISRVERAQHADAGREIAAPPGPRCTQGNFEALGKAPRGVALIEHIIGVASAVRVEKAVGHGKRKARLP
ncbi:hypothetical protein O7543_05215 [Solwaraspora sp. WMMA2080]|uniref:hypothetical protein n=1 Tax=Solwaraspora sp. WMMA2080 TaxID=3015165 RepID=UPI00248BB1EE|nr:hypothetical protein [Solwaraspora sp. WMMA2080]WBC21879.1 hypothetical protein O7543_05215 [Solwaraspora sp. WMMA2080]